MTHIPNPFNLLSWIDEHRHLLQPPVGNKQIYQDADFIVMAVGGPNSRKDYHYNEGEEFFYQVEGDITVTIQENGKARPVQIKQGDIFLLPARVPHSPRRGPNTVGIVIERIRKPEEKDGLMWFCESCNHKLYEEYFDMKDIETAFKTIFDRFYGSKELRTCKNCGQVMEPPAPVKS
jgi:3-hydroxyanthranilate 3,4-dioxygenase